MDLTNLSSVTSTEVFSFSILFRYSWLTISRILMVLCNSYIYWSLAGFDSSFIVTSLFRWLISCLLNYTCSFFDSNYNYLLVNSKVTFIWGSWSWNPGCYVLGGNRLYSRVVFSANITFASMKFFRKLTNLVREKFLDYLVVRGTPLRPKP